ncbi:ABC transporter ATP-binding protein [Thalassobius sp. S69A]|uniref:ABC transporter ATP-binding protein n=1 Tax=unclassified Thalassovita TaxID=2619711 RepID=UPI000C0FE00D|nr:ABC transporter ATP-binding protein [Paracoccaceae bacterium]MBT26310.1 ABC transporter ATP-binding protein [Paracoccaceae bacterium]
MTSAPDLTLRGDAFYGSSPVFQNADLHVPAGQWTCLLGGSGVGKSTVLNLFAGLASGVTFRGTCAASDGPLAGRVALMAQDDLLLPWRDVAANVGLGASLRGHAPDHARILRVLERVGLADKATAKPAQLSGGQRQRVALARTLIEDRPIVLLDEPFSALDARTRAQMQDLAAELLHGRTVLLVTHDPAEAARLGHVITLMTAGGLSTVAPPAGPVPRPFDAPDVLRVQATLLTLLREDSSCDQPTY